MLQSLSFKHSFKLFGALMLLIIAVSLHSFVQLYLLGEELDEMERVRFKMVAKADELRQSSNDLSDFARRYVITGDARYLANYQQVLAIRNGIEPRPEHYETIYWQLIEHKRAERHPPGSSSNLFEELQALPYSTQEREFLRAAQHHASDILHLEQDAFEAVRRVFNAGKHILGDSEEQRFAIELLHSAQYDRAIHRMMQPLDQFMIALGERMQNEIARKETAKQDILQSLPRMLLLNIALMLGAFLLVNRRLQQYHGELEEIGLRDELTGIRNRRYALSCGEQLLATNRRSQQQVAVALMDIDHFKHINDKYGHGAGDTALRAIARAIDKRTRDSDIFARYGGEEFLFVLGGINESNALRFANAIREKIQQLPVGSGGRNLHCSVSIGIAMSDDNSDLNTLIGRADKALYQAKEEGRNRVAVYKPVSRQRRSRRARLSEV